MKTQPIVAPVATRHHAPHPRLTAFLTLCFASMLHLLLQGCEAPQTGIGPRSFDTPNDAAGALTQAVRAGDRTQLLTIMGPQGEDIVSSGDEVADRQRREKFLKLYDQQHTLMKENPDTVTLLIGETGWPFPVPIVRRSHSWQFDAEAGREEILNRRIGENELAAIEVCKAIADAQREFALRTQDADGLREYARQFISDPGTHNGLYWPAAEGEEPSPLGEFAAKASAEGYKRKAEGPTPYHGYCYRILQAQGPHAPDGALNYVENNRMTLGFAVVAYPADYGNSGIMTFIMNAEGVVYQKDLGDATEQLARDMKAFDPGEGWTKAE